jgi:hypothetical protein
VVEVDFSGPKRDGLNKPGAYAPLPRTMLSLTVKLLLERSEKSSSVDFQRSNERAFSDVRDAVLSLICKGAHCTAENDLMGIRHFALTASL